MTEFVTGEKNAAEFVPLKRIRIQNNPKVIGLTNVNISTHDGYLTLDAVDCSKCFKFGGLVLLAI